MSVISIRIPPVGEGLREARIVALLKQQGEIVLRDETLYEVETDKGVLEIESPVTGVVSQWLVAEQEVHSIGTTVVLVESEEQEQADEQEADTEERRAEPFKGQAVTGDQLPKNISNRDFSPRVRAFAKSRGLSEAELAFIPRAGPVLTTADIENALASKNLKDIEKPLSPRQKLLSDNLVRSLVVPAYLEMECPWDTVDQMVECAQANPDPRHFYNPTQLSLLAWCVVQSMREHASFRSALSGNVVRQSPSARLGIAIGRPDDELVVAVLSDDKVFTAREFVFVLHKSLREALRPNLDKVQAHASPHLLLSTLWKYPVRSAVPVIVPPACATLFVGSPYESNCHPGENAATRRIVRLCLAFDHRFINGQGAAAFLHNIVTRIQELPSDYAYLQDGFGEARL